MVWSSLRYISFHFLLFLSVDVLWIATIFLLRFFSCGLFLWALYFLDGIVAWGLIMGFLVCLICLMDVWEVFLLLVSEDMRHP